MALSSQLWQQHLELANDSLCHPFVQGIGDGTLPQQTVAYYVGQDAFFLEAFARAYSIAAAKAPTWEGFTVFHDLAAGVLAELKLHQGYAQAWNVDLTAVSPGTATRQYTDFLLATAWSQPIGVTAVAMAPCMRLAKWSRLPTAMPWRASAAFLRPRGDLAAKLSSATGRSIAAINRHQRNSLDGFATVEHRGTAM